MNRKNILRIGIIAAVLFLAGIYFKSLYISLQAESAQVKSELERLKVEEKILQNFLNRQEQVTEFIELSEENFLSAQEFLPTDSEQEKFTETIYSAANKNSVQVISLQIGELLPVESPKDFSGEFYKQSVKIQLEAEYVSLLNFIREVLDGERFATFANISLDSEENILIGEVEFFIYSAKFAE